MPEIPGLAEPRRRPREPGTRVGEPHQPRHAGPGGSQGPMNSTTGIVAIADRGLHDRLRTQPGLAEVSSWKSSACGCSQGSPCGTDASCDIHTRVGGRPMRRWSVRPSSLRQLSSHSDMRSDFE